MFNEKVLRGNRDSRQYFVYRHRQILADWIQGEPPWCEEPLEKHLRLLRNRSASLKIGFSSAGGMGDMLCLARYLAATKRKYPDSLLFVFLECPRNAELFMDNPIVDGVFALPFGYYKRHFKKILRSGHLDVLFDIRYLVKPRFGRRCRLPARDRREMFGRFEQLSGVNYDIFPRENNQMGKTARQLNYGLLDLMGHTAGIDVKNVPPCLSAAAADVRAVCDITTAKEPYVTIHNGIGGYFNGTGYPTKNWSPTEWELLAKRLKERGLRVYQLGTANEKPIPGADHCLLGTLTLNQTALVLKNARLHFDTEGGLVHLNAAAGGRSAVLFGPTPIDFFGYGQNVNIKEGNCHDCWWTTTDWLDRCPRGHARPVCMRSITAELVLQQTAAVLAKKENPARHEIVETAFFDPRDFSAEALEWLQALYEKMGLEYAGPRRRATESRHGVHVGETQNWEYLFALKAIKKYWASEARPAILDVGAGRGALSPYLNRAGIAAATVIDLDYRADARNPGSDFQNRFLRLGKEGLKIDFGSAYCLPYPPESFDFVLAISVFEHLEEKKFALKEMLRALKPGGKIILTGGFLHPDFEGCPDKNRVAIFDRKSWKTVFGEVVGRELELSAELLSKSHREFQAFGFEGLPEGLTIGGLVLSKEKA
jgi:ADP-heptose:LPS heptosyltransferase/SAM-dependent methyltransferase